MTELERVQSKYAMLGSILNERQCRLWAAAEAQVLGRGGITLVALATGMTRQRIRAGLRELQEHDAQVPESAKPRRERVRRPGGGRRPLSDNDPELVQALDALVSPATRGDPMSPLRWTSKSTSQLARALMAKGHPVSPRSVAALLKAQDYSLQSTRKSREGKDHPD